MIREEEVPAFGYYGYGQPFTGSDKGKRYRIEGKKEEKTFTASVWKDFLSYENTPKEEIKEKEFEFSPLGLKGAVAWINETSVVI